MKQFMRLSVAVVKLDEHLDRAMIDLENKAAVQKLTYKVPVRKDLPRWIAAFPKAIKEVVIQSMAKAKEEALSYHKISDLVFAVRSSDTTHIHAYKVDIREFRCDCWAFRTKLLPCKHMCTILRTDDASWTDVRELYRCDAKFTGWEFDEALYPPFRGSPVATPAVSPTPTTPSSIARTPLLSDAFPSAAGAIAVQFPVTPTSSRSYQSSTAEDSPAQDKVMQQLAHIRAVAYNSTPEQLKELLEPLKGLSKRQDKINGTPKAKPGSGKRKGAPKSGKTKIRKGDWQEDS